MNTANPYAPPRAPVQDVEDSAATLADPGTRLGAAILDGIIFLAMIYIPLVIGFSLKANGHIGPIVGEALGGFLAVAGLVTWLCLTIIFVSRNGQSIAKKLLGIKVVCTDGSPASVFQIIFLRNVLNTVLGLVPFYGFVDALFIFGEKRQCIHDKLAGTIVIKA
jgi:uncharacterized RDD family membrane protein YckC